MEFELRDTLTTHKDISCHGILGMTVLSMRRISQSLTKKNCYFVSMYTNNDVCLY